MQRTLVRQRDYSPRPEIDLGDAVEVTEEGITPWTGVVQSVKHSRITGWWIDVARPDYGTHVVHASKVAVIERARA